MTKDHHEIIRNFYRIRQVLGLLGMSLPLLLLLGGLLTLGRVEPSISDYYHTILRDLFVGIMFAIALFLICYTGHKRGEGDRVSDDWVTSVAGIAALGVAVFPNAGHPSGAELSFMQTVFGTGPAEILHYVMAVIFLASTGYLSFFRFARTAQPLRRKIYRICGVTIWVVTVLVIITSYIKIKGTAGPQEFVRDWCIVFWFETIGIWAFSVAWLVKGQVDFGLLSLLGATNADAEEAPGELKS